MTEKLQDVIDDIEAAISLGRTIETAELKYFRRIAQEAEKDAARYRWLRDVGDCTWKPLGKRYMDSCALPNDVDAAIDAAIKKTNNWLAENSLPEWAP